MHIKPLLNASFPALPYPERLLPLRLQETPINVCCCFNRGFASANIAVDKDRYQPGEQANVILQAENQSSEGFTSVEAS